MINIKRNKAKVMNTYGNCYIKISCDYEPGFYTDSDYVVYIDLLEHGNNEPIETHTADIGNSESIEFWVKELKTIAELMKQEMV